MAHVWSGLIPLLNLLWLGLTLLGLPGNWLMLATAAAIAWLTTGPPSYHWATLAVGVSIAAIGELFELLSGAAGSRRSGGSRRGGVGALLGGIAGAVVGTFALPVPLLGTVLGAAAGAFAGAVLGELTGEKTREEALRSGRGAAIGHVAGIASKFLLGCGLWLLLAVGAFV
jgi:hypothetical protein